MKNEKPTIIILTPGFPTDETDSTCLPLLQTLLISLKENFPNVNIIILSFEYPFFKGTYKWHGFDVVSLNGYNKRKLFRLILWREALKQLKNIYTRNKVIGLLSLWCGECAWIGKKFSRKHNLKHYCWLWGQDARKGNKYVSRIRPSANELIALSDFLRSEFEKNYSIRSAEVIPPGIDIQQYKWKNDVRDIDVLGVGSLIPLKQYNIFVDVIGELRKYFPNIKAVLCGKGPEEYKLQKQIEELGLKKNITLAGEVSHQEVIQLMQRSKLLLHTSMYEGFGLVCAEALYAGAHVISFCKVMNEEILHWYTTNSKEEMIKRAFEILNSSQTEFKPVLAYNISDTSKQLMKLFGL